MSIYSRLWTDDNNKMFMSCGTTLSLVIELKAQIWNHVEIMNLRELHWLLSIEVTWNHEEQTIALLQWFYLDLIICHFGFDDLKPVSIPMELHI